MPLYSQVALSSGLHATLNAASTNSTITVSSTLGGIQQPDAVATMTRQIAQTMQNDIRGDAVDPTPRFVVRTGGTSILSPNQGPQFLAQLSSGQVSQRALASSPQIQLVGLGQDQLTSHVHLLQGRLPRQASNAIEISLLPSVARCLFLYVPSSAQSATRAVFPLESAMRLQSSRLLLIWCQIHEELGGYPAPVHLSSADQNEPGDPQISTT